MRSPTRLFHWLCLAAACLAPPVALAQKQTVCTITINSADEQKAFRRFLPQDKYDFVELVERNRPDWLASACQAKVSCDMLIISGHYGEGNEFFSDALEVRDSLSIGELERVSCSGSCPNLFEHLKEVYLFGCDTLNPHAQRTASEEIVRSLLREGRSPAEATRLARQLLTERGESSRDRMRLVFKDVPVIYGFSSAAPLGPVAASSLNRFFQGGGARQVGRGEASAALLRTFSTQGLASARGIGADDPLVAMRRDVCTFAAEQPEGQRLAAVHELLKRPTAQSRLLLDRLERYTQTLDARTREQPEVARELSAIAADTESRDRFLAFARDADEARTRARMVNVAHALGWLSPQQRTDELAALFTDLLAHKRIAPPDVDLACTLNKDGGLDAAMQRVATPASRAQDVGAAAVLACLGNSPAHERTLEGLVSPAEADVSLAHAYLRNRPLKHASELRTLTRTIAGIRSPELQVRALEALGRQYLSDPVSIGTLKELYSRTGSGKVQNAIASVLLRAESKALGPSELLRTLREFRIQPSPGDNMVDALIQRLQLSRAGAVT
jgi:hypothetical protein